MTLVDFSPCRTQKPSSHGFQTEVNFKSIDHDYHLNLFANAKFYANCLRFCLTNVYREEWAALRNVKLWPATNNQPDK